MRSLILTTLLIFGAWGMGVSFGQVGDGDPDGNPRKRAIALSTTQQNGPQDPGDPDGIWLKTINRTIFCEAHISTMKTNIQSLEILNNAIITIQGELRIFDGTQLISTIPYSPEYVEHLYNPNGTCSSSCLNDYYLKQIEMDFNLNHYPNLDPYSTCTQLNSLTFEVEAWLVALSPGFNGFNSYYNLYPTNFSDCSDDSVIWPETCYFTQYYSDILQATGLVCP